MGTVIRLRRLLERYRGVGYDEEALWLLGRAYVAVAMPDRAKGAWSELVDKYPKSSVPAMPSRRSRGCMPRRCPRRAPRSRGRAEHTAADSTEQAGEPGERARASGAHTRGTCPLAGGARASPAAPAPK